MVGLQTEQLTRRKVINYSKSKFFVYSPSLCGYVLQYCHDLDEHHLNFFHGPKFSIQPSFVVRPGHDVGSGLCIIEDRPKLKKTGNKDYICIDPLEIIQKYSCVCLLLCEIDRSGSSCTVYLVAFTRRIMHIRDVQKSEKYL